MALLVDLLKLLDLALARPLCGLVGMVVPQAGPTANEDAPPTRILVIRPGGIGDAVLFLPLLRELRRVWPNSVLDVLAERRNAGVVHGTGLADDVLRYDAFPHDLLQVLRRRYDLVIDTEQYHAMSALVTAATGAPRRIGFGTNLRRRLFTQVVPYDQLRYETLLFLELGREATGREPTWDPNVPFYDLQPAAIEFAQHVLAPLAGRTLVTIHPGASIPERRWPVERYAELARSLVEDGFAVVVIGGKADHAAAQVIARNFSPNTLLDLTGRTSLAEAAAVIARSAVYVSADTGPLHLAYAVGVPTVHLFGAGVLQKWGPPGRKFRSLAAAVPCSPCTVYGYTPPCVQGLACMLGITSADVRNAVLAIASPRAAGQLVRDREATS